MPPRTGLFYENAGDSEKYLDGVRPEKTAARGRPQRGALPREARWNCGYAIRVSARAGRTGRMRVNLGSDIVTRYASRATVDAPAENKLDPAFDESEHRAGLSSHVDTTEIPQYHHCSQRDPLGGLRHANHRHRASIAVTINPVRPHHGIRAHSRSPRWRRSAQRSSAGWPNPAQHRGRTGQVQPGPGSGTGPRVACP